MKIVDLKDRGWELFTVIFLGTWFLFSQKSFSQTNTVRIYGTVTDEEYNGIYEAMVSFISQANGDTTSTQTDANGDYSLQLVLTEAGVREGQPPSGFQLHQNYPNPFNPGTVIEFELPQASHVRLTVFNLRGQVVRVLEEGFYPAGLSVVRWDGTDGIGKGVAAGIYFYQLKTENSAKMRKMLLLDGHGGTIGSPFTSSRKSLLNPKMMSQETFTIYAEKEGFYPFVDENFVVTSEDTAFEKNIVLAELGTWQYLGFEDKLVLRLRLYEPYLYACAGSDGLWRKDIETEDSDWEYLGMADTSLGQYLHRGVMDVVVNSDNTDVMLVTFFPDSGSAHGIFKTEDEGNTWFASDSGLEFHFPPPWDDETYYEHPTIFLQTPYDLFAAGTKLVHTNNFGETWEVITPIGPPPAAATYDFRCHSEDTNMLWLGGESVYFSPILNFSMDSGATWDYVPLETMVTLDNAVYSIALDPYDSDIFYVSLYREIIKTTDGGASWIVPLMSYDGPGHIRCIVEDDTQSGHLFAAAGYTTMETEDGGMSWIDLQSPNGSGIISMVYDSEEKALYIGTGSWPTPSGVFIYK